MQPTIAVLQQISTSLNEPLIILGSLSNLINNSTVGRCFCCLLGRMSVCFGDPNMKEPMRRKWEFKNSCNKDIIKILRNYPQWKRVWDHFDALHGRLAMRNSSQPLLVRHGLRKSVVARPVRQDRDVLLVAPSQLRPEDQAQRPSLAHGSRQNLSTPVHRKAVRTGTNNINLICFFSGQCRKLGLDLNVRFEAHDVHPLYGWTPALLVWVQPNKYICYYFQCKQIYWIRTIPTYRDTSPYKVSEYSLATIFLN